MSLSALAWAIKADCTPTQKLVLVALANTVNGADEANTCFPSQAYLVNLTGYSKPTIVRALAGLEESGLIVRRHRYKPNGMRTSDVTYLQVAPEPGGYQRDTKATTSDQSDHLGGKPLIPKGVSEVYPNLLKEKLLEENPAPPPAALFDSWYSRYPRKKAKAAAEKAYAKAVKRTNPSELDAGLDRFLTHLEAKGTRPEFIPYPATWLNADSWADEYETQPEQPCLAPWTPQPPPEDIEDDPAACDRWYRDQAAKRAAS